MPRLRVLAGPSFDNLAPINANNDVAYPIAGDHFEGRVAVYIRLDDRPAHHQARYFDRKERKGVTWSIQVQGRFLDTHSADDILFGNVFERPLKLPWGSGAALKFMHFVDPTLEHDLGGVRPWALSPFVSTMPYMAHTSLPSSEFKSSSTSSITSGNSDQDRWPAFPPRTPLVDSFPLHSKRRAYFSSRPHRAQTHIGPSDLITTDFCYGFLNFPSITLKLPCGLSFDCLKYWDGQPVSFVCCERDRSGKGPGAKVFWCVVFEIVPDAEE
ncbi:DUF1769-domain-containing protein [Exidia glandulosa HHB12029]|uniref:DUF1769-domain-containing protein n=1 Tax=Exidia glandulosa HHB12029 TaxID=1314781 RepID=A0A165MLH9_EXIGL|nr:DUF1769-domain-containing protein [Exidia glandulosa HHB12029]